MKKLLLLCAALPMTLVAQAQALDSFYVGFGVAQGKANPDGFSCPTGANCSDAVTATKWFVGRDLGKNFAAEVSYGNWGQYDGGATLKATYAGVGAAGILKLPLDQRFGLFGKLGLALGMNKFEAGNASTNSSSLGVLYGGGAEYKVTQYIHVRGEYEVRSASVDSAGTTYKANPSTVGIGLIYKF
jgi:OmpA-OmpF porin, OOP family